MNERRRHPYTEEEDRFIEENYAALSPKGLEPILQRSRSAIAHRASRLGCSKKATKSIFAEDVKDLDGEKWKPICGYEGYYEISNMGRVKTVSRTRRDGVRIKGILKKTGMDACGYELVELSKDGQKEHLSVHRLVAMAFIPNPLNLPQVNHKDEIRNHNSADNLEWCSVIYNQNYGHRKEKSSLSATGSKNANHKLTENDVLSIRKEYIPGDKEFGVKPLSIKYGVKYVTISKIVQRRIWKHI